MVYFFGPFLRCLQIIHYLCREINGKNNNHKTIQIMRKIVLLAFATLLALVTWSPTAHAGELEIQIDDIEVQPGGNHVMANVYVEHDNYFSAIELHFALIDGIEFGATTPKDEDMTQPWPMGGVPGVVEFPIQWYPMYNTDLASSEFKVIMTFNRNNLDGVIAYFPPGRTLICRIIVEASENFTGGTLHLNYAKTDYSDPTPGAPVANVAEISDVDVCQIKIPDATTPLAAIVAEGVEGTEYTVADNLAVVSKGTNCVFVTDGEDNWIKVAADDDVFTTLATMDYIEGGTLVGTLSDANCNPTLTVTNAPTEGAIEVPYETLEWNLQDIFIPKTNSVIKLTGYWNENEGTFCGYPDGGGQIVTANFTWCEGEYNIVNGALYTDVVSIVQLKAPWDNGSKMSADDELAYQNLIVYPTSITEENQFVGIENLKGNKKVVNMQYANICGQLADTPFEGLNIVITRYEDGTTMTTKVIK